MKIYNKYLKVFVVTLCFLFFSSCSNDDFVNDQTVDANIHIIDLDKIESKEKRELIQKRYASCGSSRTVTYRNRTAASCIQSARNYRLSYRHISGTYTSDGGVCTLFLSNDPSLNPSCTVEYEPVN